MLKLNVGFNRKVGESNYGSRGASVNLELEAESGLASDPEKLRERIRFLFALAKASVEEELHGQAGNGRSTHGNDHGQRRDATRKATASQGRASYMRLPIGKESTWPLCCGSVSASIKRVT